MQLKALDPLRAGLCEIAAAKLSKPRQIEASNSRIEIPEYEWAGRWSTQLYRLSNVDLPRPISTTERKIVGTQFLKGSLLVVLQRMSDGLYTQERSPDF